MNKTYAYNHKPIPFDFAQTVERFFVEEVPLFSFSNKGSYLILKIKKSNMSTFKLITVLAKATKLEQRDIGYAGLKDKNATTVQFISIPKNVEQEVIKNLTTEKIEVLDKKYSKFPIKVGQLKGNNFSIILKNVSLIQKEQIEKVATKMLNDGIPNYYGYQRFGEDSKSYIQGKEIAHSGKKLKGAKEKLLVSAYQSYLFNQWLSHRVNISKAVNENDVTTASKKLEYPLELVKVLKQQAQFFKLFIGDDMQSYPCGKSHYLQEFEKSVKAFQNQKFSPTGLLVGMKAKKAMGDARYLEEEFDDDELYSLKGDRRYAWIFPKDLSLHYYREQEELRINFYLPKGAYATTFLEEIGKHSLKTR
jgi:tRNA pseudouridine13 synthase